MVLPKTLARFNRIATNRVAGRIAPHMPGMGLLTHVGRRSGRRYRTPLNAFPTRDGYVLPVTYGADSDWVRNVLAAGGGDLTTRGRTVRLEQARLVTDRTRAAVPAVARPLLGLAGVDEFVFLTEAAGGSSDTPPSGSDGD
ncbi:nitroreductase family deazaflavin-dependent oxidoreductase [Saccharomonospora iraqiensis]|uniref:nitroreductase family deazaflavin-dependent oxidoreductase n=1 Tax=Saccharomonospora iraqiensis TaxID=52698 RepID=UPI00047C6BF7|nr:nitroreductase family deazaflavin-dependent oxidoreductase [Saccharomonospora iraqiensis]